MNWEAIGAVGEVLGAIGVIATLGYLALQIRQNSNTVRSSIRQAISTTQHEAGLQMAATPDLRAAIARWANGEVPSTQDEALCDDILLRAMVRTFENQYHQHRDGTFGDEMWVGYRENMRRFRLSPRFDEFWVTNRTLYSTDFARFIKEQIPGASGDESDVANDL
jgi:hypothetical protein